MEAMLKDYVIYRNKPLVRNGNIICCGNPSDPAILILTVLTTKPYADTEVPDNILIQVQSTDQNLPTVDRGLKQGVKQGLYEALDLGITWLEKALEK